MSLFFSFEGLRIWDTPYPYGKRPSVSLARENMGVAVSVNIDADTLSSAKALQKRGVKVAKERECRHYPRKKTSYRDMKSETSMASRSVASILQCKRSGYAAPWLIALDGGDRTGGGARREADHFLWVRGKQQQDGKVGPVLSVKGPRQASTSFGVKTETSFGKDGRGGEIGGAPHNQAATIKVPHTEYLKWVGVAAAIGMGPAPSAWQSFLAARLPAVNDLGTQGTHAITEFTGRDLDLGLDRW
ncbi:hypothetical protein V8F33_012927 [Rhypophila sp. PSN 637]